MERFADFESPVGLLRIVEAGGSIVRLDWATGRSPRADTPPASTVLDNASGQLRAFFAGRLRCFDLPLAPVGTPFQHRVWRQLARIPFGETRSYGDIARALRTAPRPVGGACGRNPLPIFIPCHRVLGGGNAIGGYSGGGGNATKSWLLRHEGARPIP